MVTLLNGSFVYIKKLNIEGEEFKTSSEARAFLDSIDSMSKEDDNHAQKSLQAQYNIAECAYFEDFIEASPASRLRPAKLIVFRE